MHRQARILIIRVFHIIRYSLIRLYRHLHRQLTAYLKVAMYQMRIQLMLRIKVYHFFVVQDGSGVLTATTVSVNSALLEDADKLATKSNVGDGESQCDLIEQINALQKKKIFDGGTGAYFLESIVSDVSIDSSKAKTFLSNYNNMKTTIQNQRLSVMGVDTDEEAMDLMKFQQAYNLNSKMMSVMNEIYDKLINQTGL